jgi:hypothetical protein
MTAPSIARATEIERLAALESIDYEVVRVDEAKTAWHPLWDS